jgi:tRNA splicing endonuclease
MQFIVDKNIVERNLLDFDLNLIQPDPLEYAVFKDLTLNKKLYVTDAIKFGGTFLVYEGEPSLYHAKYIVVVLRGETID